MVMMLFMHLGRANRGQGPGPGVQWGHVGRLHCDGGCDELPGCHAVCSAVTTDGPDKSHLTRMPTQAWALYSAP